MNNIFVDDIKTSVKIDKLTRQEILDKYYASKIVSHIKSKIQCYKQQESGRY